jgi:hypothetical protein
MTLSLLLNHLNVIKIQSRNHSEGTFSKKITREKKYEICQNSQNLTKN